MASKRTRSAGVCPECRTELSEVDVIIEYERTDGEPAAFADCPTCQTVVHPV